jgi:formate dehydrogenase major subunit
LSACRLVFAKVARAVQRTWLESSTMPRVVINRVATELPAGGTVLDALRRHGIHLPAICHDDRMVPAGVCRLCLVQVKGLPRLVPACTTRLVDGMEIQTDTPELEATRLGILKMLARRYPAQPIARFPEKPFHRELVAAGLTEHASPKASDPDRRDDSHPYIAVDMSRCIDCYRCVQICDELQGQFVWHVRDRGFGTRVVADGGTLRDSPCVSCGACIDTCPTGALEDKGVTTLEPATQWTRTVCPYCGVGCELSVGTRNNHIVSVRPALAAAVNKGHLCVKGRYAFGFVSAADRVTEPMLRDGTGWRRVSWNEARAYVTDRLSVLIARHGADSVGILGSARATNEDAYITQKFARAVIGTNNVDCCARVCHAPSAMALKLALGAGLSTNSFDDIEIARTILVCGANATENHPVVGARIKQAARRGADLIVIDPRRIELAQYASCHLAPNPGTNVPLFNAMAQTIVADGSYDRGFVDHRVSAFTTFTAFIKEWTPERAADICGVDPNAIRRAARLYATNAPAMSIHGLGLTEHVDGTDEVAALINLAMLTGNIGRPGAGINPLRGQNNVQGAAHMGCDPSVLPGSIGVEEGRATFDAFWEARLPHPRGLNALEMFDAASAGRLKALWTVGYDVLLSNPNQTETRRALRSLELVVVQDLFLTETARECGTVFLPACSPFEKDGTFMNAERRIQRVRAALRPIGGSKPDWQIVSEIARAMGARGFSFAGPGEIWNEVRALCDGARGMTYARLDQRGLQWPCPAEDHPGTAILHRETFPMGSRAALRTIDYRATPEVTTPEYPFVLITGRSLYQFNAGTMTGRTRNNELRPSDLLDISPSDARGLDLEDGRVIRVESRYGSAQLPVHIDSTIRAGQLFATFQTPDLRVNALTGPYRDARVGTPEYKITAVRLCL